MGRLPLALVVDDERSVRGFIAEVLRSEEWQVAEADSAESAFAAISESDFDLVFSDVMLGASDGYQVLRRLREERPNARCVLMTGHGSAAGALDATAIGAFDYLLKPFSVADIVRISSMVREQIQLRRRQETTAPADEAGYRSDIPLIGNSPRFVESLKLVGRVAPTGLPVLITGESGTGKEIVANAVHRRSERAGGPFVTVNCGAIPETLIETELFGHAKGSFTGASSERMGLWEEANGGTIFLDEITETQPLFQVKLLRALQESEIRRVGANRTIRVDARVICATNRDIEKEVDAGRFRQDLMYRLNAVTIELPPLRERIEDIPLLADHFARRSGSERARFSREAVDVLARYPWPGNVRELENAVLHAVSIADDVVYPEHLPERVRSGRPAANAAAAEPRAADPLAEFSRGPAGYVTLAEMETRYVTRVLESTKGNKQAAAKILDIDRKTLSRIVARNGGEV